MLQERMDKFLEKNSLKEIEKIARGHSAFIYLVENSAGKKLLLKIERDDSPRVDFVGKESTHLKKANSIGVGPKLISFDEECRCILREFVDGITLSEFIYSNPLKKDLQKVIDSLLVQAKKMDEIGLDHGQLAGRGKNILVTKKLNPVIIDFEKASQNRKCGNLNQLKSFLFRNPNSSIAKTVKEILGKDYSFPDSFI
ncbi:MAG: hypothetical protein ABID38_07200 [Candidatus Diapherotrites archaeon]